MTALSRYLQRNIKGLPSQGSGTSLRKTRIFPSEENPLGFRVRSPRPCGRETVPAHPQTASSGISPPSFVRRSSSAYQSQWAGGMDGPDRAGVEGLARTKPISRRFGLVCLSV